MYFESRAVFKILEIEFQKSYVPINSQHFFFRRFGPKFFQAYLFTDRLELNLYNKDPHYHKLQTFRHFQYIII